MQYLQPAPSVQSYQCLSYKTQSTIIINIIIFESFCLCQQDIGIEYVIAQCSRVTVKAELYCRYEVVKEKVHCRNSTFPQGGLFFPLERSLLHDKRNKITVQN